MKVRLKYHQDRIDIDEVFEADTCEDVLSAMKDRVALQAGLAARLMINAMAPVSFAQEVVRRYNRHSGARLPVPTSCSEFMSLGEREGILSVLEG